MTVYMKAENDSILSWKKFVEFVKLAANKNPDGQKLVRTCFKKGL